MNVSKIIVKALSELAPNTEFKCDIFNDSKTDWVAEARPWYKQILFNEYMIIKDKYNKDELYCCIAHEVGHFKTPLVKDRKSLWELNSQLWAIGRCLELNDLKNSKWLIENLQYWKNKNNKINDVYKRASIIADKFKVYSKITRSNPYWVVIQDINSEYHLIKTESKAKKYNWCFDD